MFFVEYMHNKICSYLFNPPHFKIRLNRTLFTL